VSVNSVPFGRLFRLDGHFMTSERDEFFYHENLVHMPGLSHPAPARALIVGGGDGGSAEELLKYPTMKSVTLCEIDLAVVDIARKHLGEVHRGAFDDPRLTLRIGDGFAFVRESSEQYDLVILDCPPNLGALTAAALLAADHCLVPLQAEELAYRALPRLFDGLDELRRQGRHLPTLLGIVASAAAFALVFAIRRPPSQLVSDDSD